jgi:hypothetical protein
MSKSNISINLNMNEDEIKVKHGNFFFEFSEYFLKIKNIEDSLKGK